MADTQGEGGGGGQDEALGPPDAPFALAACAAQVGGGLVGGAEI